MKTIVNILQDKTTLKNIILATTNYGYPEETELTIDLLNNIDIKPRVLKNKEIQKERTKKRAEVFTPSWLCNQMNNFCDKEWFGRKDVFNIECEKSWKTIEDKIVFPKEKTWQDYVLSTRLEITCGEAPYLVSRYDTATGEMIDVFKRVGMLDRKLRIVNENTFNENDWFEWVKKAYKSIYAYEFQGDNLLIARINLLLTFVEYMNYKWGKEPTEEQLKEIAEIIIWNIWQMNGLTNEIPFTNVYARIKDWEMENVICFKDLFLR